MPATDESLAATLLELCAIKSIFGNEREIADEVERRLRKTPLAPTVRRIGESVLAGTTRPGRPSIGIFGHTDTVPDAGNAWPPRREGDLVFGLGASDMKAGLAVMLALAEEPPVDHDLVLCFYDKEEGPYEANGLEPVLEQHAFLRDLTLAFCMEPTDLEVQLGCVGSLHADVVFHGKSAHSARPWHGENAIHKAAKFLDRLQAWGVREVEPAPGLVFREVASATTASGGTGRNVIPGKFIVHVNLRYAPGRTAADAERDLAELVQGQAEVIVQDRSPSAAVPASNPLLERFKELAGTKVAPKQAWTDVARLGMRGIPAANFGPGYTSQAHQKDERASVKMMGDAYRALRALLT